MRAIYEPRGKALEYSALACNLYTGCRHGCRYCYCPRIAHTTLDQWAADPKPRPGMLPALEADAARLHGDRREILFCFMSDPYQSDEAASLTGAALSVCARRALRAQILTKAGLRALAHFPLLAAQGWKFGTTLIFSEEGSRVEWEPGAASLEERRVVIREARARGIYTWVSVEPVIDPRQAIEVIREMKPYVDMWKIGKINHNRALEAAVDWAAFLASAERHLDGAPHYIKRDLLVAAGRPI